MNRGGKKPVCRNGPEKSVRKPASHRMMERYFIIGGKVLLPSGLRETNLELSEGVISGIGHDIIPDASSRVVNAEGKYILPGFIDIHTNGIAGFDLTSGVYKPREEAFDAGKEAYAAGIERALRKYAERGVTRVTLSSLAAPIDELKQAFRSVHDYNIKSGNPLWKEVLAGLYVEGTFMKLPEYAGAHNPDYFNEPSRDLFNELQQAAGGLIKIANVVPEWGEPGEKLIDYLSSQGVVCAAGHTGATAVQYDRAITIGTKLAVHFLNGPTGSSFKSFDGGGALESVLRNPGMFVEIIADGYHVDKSYVMDTIRRKGVDKVVVVTDSMFVTCLEEVERFVMFGVEGKVAPNREYVGVAGKTNTLFGSMLTMDVAFSNLLNWMTSRVEGVWRDEHVPVSLEQALVDASAMCCGNPARVLGIFEPGKAEENPDMREYTGSIEVGKSADILVGRLDRPDDRYKLNVEKVFIKGQSI